MKNRDNNIFFAAHRWVKWSAKVARGRGGQKFATDRDERIALLRRGRAGWLLSSLIIPLFHANNHRTNFTCHSISQNIHSFFAQVFRKIMKYKIPLMYLHDEILLISSGVHSLLEARISGFKSCCKYSKFFFSIIVSRGLNRVERRVACIRRGRRMAAL